MELLFTQYRYLIFGFLLLMQSCNSNSQVNKQTNKKDTTIGYLDSKYQNKYGYQYIIDESSISDHPFYLYLDCLKEGYFGVHFIPKTEELQNFWKNTYFNNYYTDSVNEDKIITDIVKNNYSSYIIFSYRIPSEYLENQDGCTLESVYAKSNSMAYIYLYDQKNKEWKKIKTIKSDILPPYIDTKFFKSEFSVYFK